METIIWIFEKVMPWVGIYFITMTMIFFVSLAIDILKYKGIKNIRDHCDITEPTMNNSVIVNLIPAFSIFFISLFVEKIIKRSKAKKAKAEEA